MNEMIQSPTATQPVAEPVNDGCYYFTKIVLQTTNGQIEVETSVHDSVVFLASYGVSDATKPLLTVLCKTHWMSVYSQNGLEAKALMFAPGDWCSGCKALLAMPSVAPSMPLVVNAPVVVPAGSQLHLEHTQHGNGAQAATATSSVPANVMVVLPVLTEADLDSIMRAHFAAKQEVMRLQGELETAKAKAVEPFKPLLDRGIKKMTWAGNKYALVQKAGQLPYLRTGEK